MLRHSRLECVSACASDAELLRRIVAGEREALGALYGRHARTMTDAGLRILGARSEVEDVLHDVFLELWRRAPDYDPGRGTVKSWMLVRMRSRCIDRARTSAVRRVDRGRVPVVEADFEPRAEAARLRALVGALPAAQRRVMELGYFGGFSISEIAAELAVPVGTVKSRLSTALGALRTELGVPRPLGAMEPKAPGAPASACAGRSLYVEQRAERSEQQVAGAPRQHGQQIRD